MAEPLPTFDQLFTRTSGWTAGDGASSVPISPDKTLWFFSDSMIGKTRNGRHTRGSRMVSNAVAVQTGLDPASATLEFFWGTKREGKPGAFFNPVGDEGRFWIFEAVRTGRGLFLFLQSTTRTDDDGFVHSGTSLGHVENPADRPDRWRVRIKQLPFGHFAPRGGALYGSAVLKEGGFVYVYGAAEENALFYPKHMIVARVPEDEIADFTKWRFLRGDEWQPDSTQASWILRDVANEYSVVYLPSIRRYVLLYFPGLSDEISVRTSANPVGPWSSPQIVFRCPDPSRDKRTFCYEAEAHPELSSKPGELVISYIVNSHDFFHMLSDASLYRPRFVKLKFTIEEEK